MDTNYISQLKNIYTKYRDIHESIHKLQEESILLETKREALHTELDSTRNQEKVLINKIEESLNRKITQEDLFKIIESDGTN